MIIFDRTAKTNIGPVFEGKKGFVMGRAIDVKTPVDDLVSIVISEWDSEGNALAEHDFQSGVSDAEISSAVEAKCKGEDFFQKGYSLRCNKGKFNIELIVSGNSFAESKNEATRLAKAIANVIA